MKKNAGLQLGEVFVRGLILMKNTLILTIMIDIMIMIDIFEYMALCQFKGSFIVVYCGEPLYSTFFVTYATIGQGSKHLRLFRLSCYFFLGFFECFLKRILWL